MIYEGSPQAILIFTLFVGFTLGLSFWLGRKAKSSEGFFAAHGQIPWFVNGIAFAGDYLSAASFLGICGMIAFYGYDGFLYSIGYLAGWIVALFVVAEPMKRLGKFTFADALDSQFNSRGIKLAAGISTLAVSVFYLIPQMVGAGALVTPLLGWPHWAGVIVVGTVVVLIVVTAGMVSTTWVQFLKGSLLVFFSAILTWMILQRGLEVKDSGEDGYQFRSVTLSATDLEGGTQLPEPLAGLEVVPNAGPWAETKTQFVRFRDPATDRVTVWHRVDSGEPGQITLHEAQSVQTIEGEATPVVNGLPLTQENQLHPVGYLSRLSDDRQSTGPLGPLAFFSELQDSEVTLWPGEKVEEKIDSRKSTTTVYYRKATPGAHVLRPGEHPTFKGIRSEKPLDKLNFVSLMLALFCGTASLPHILIRYYTVKDGAAARKSTIVGIGCIGFFYVLTLYLGLGAMTSGAMDVTNSNMAAPLLALSMSELLFAIISAIAFTTVLGTVSGLILASAGA
ncbi:MAG: cation acetate symporter, partial [Planctomycetaceae bacterium]|nr:cation acetate symporter [Planctomycetaceae bacterium]